MKKTPDRFAAAYRESNPGEAMPGVCFPPSYRFAGGAWRSNGEAGEATNKPPTRITVPPPYCYLQPGISTEAAALAAVKALSIETLIDVLAILWELRRVAAKEASE